jgi:hypothetical protein
MAEKYSRGFEKQYLQEKVRIISKKCNFILKLTSHGLVGDLARTVVCIASLYVSDYQPRVEVGHNIATVAQ